MKKSQWFVIVAVVAVLSVAGGFVGHKVEDIRDQEYHQGTAFLVGIGDHKTAFGTAVFEKTPQGAVLKVQLQAVPEVANTTLDIMIATTPLADEVMVGTIQIDSLGKGIATIKARAMNFPTIQNGSLITLRTALIRGEFTVRTVAQGTFGAP